MVDSAVELKRAVYAAEPDWLFRKFLCSLKDYSVSEDYRRSSTKDRRDKLINFLKVENGVKPIIFNDMKYSKALHDNCMFMFLDDELRVIGFLLGNEWNEKWKNYESYSAGRPGSTYLHDVVKNRKNMTEKAAYILMFTPEMRKKNNIVKTKAKHRMHHGNHERELLDRLNKYKRNKHGSMTYEQIIDMTKKIIHELASALGSEREDEVVKRCRSISSFNDNIGDVLRKVGEILKDYRWNYDQQKQQEKYWLEKYGKEEFEKLKKSKELYFSHDPRQYVIALVDYKKAIFREE